MQTTTNARASAKLVNHKVLIQMAETVARKGVWSWPMERVGWVELIKDGLTEKLFNWMDICWRTASMGSVGPGWRS